MYADQFVDKQTRKRYNWMEKVGKQHMIFPGKTCVQCICLNMEIGELLALILALLGGFTKDRNFFIRAVRQVLIKEWFLAQDVNLE
jgi:hypothetical protein